MSEILQRYKYKVIVAGDEIELYEYDHKQYKTQKKEPEEKQDDEIKVPEEKSGTVEIADSNYKRNPINVRTMKVKLRRLINANAFQYTEQDKFITLTFEGKKPTRKEVVNKFRYFNERLKKAYPLVDYKYIAVIEQGKYNTHRLHIHCLFFNLPFIHYTEFQQIWKYGTVDMQAIDSFYDLAGYVVKYIEKTLEDGSIIPKGKRFYFTSRGLIKPQTYFVNDDEIDEFLEANCHDKDLAFETDFDSEFTGKCHYLKYAKVRNVKPRIENEEDLLFYLDMLEGMDT